MAKNSCSATMMNKDNYRKDRTRLVDALQDAGAVFAGTSNYLRCPFHNDRTPSAAIYRKAGIWRFRCHACGTGGDYYDIIAKTKGVRYAHEELRHAAREQDKVFASAHASSWSADGPRVPSVPHGTGGRGVVGGTKQGYNKPAPAKFAQKNSASERKPLVLKDLDEIKERYPTWKNIYEYKKSDLARPDLIIVRLEDETGKSFRQFTPCDAGYVAKGIDGVKPLYNRQNLQSDTLFVVEGEKCVEALSTIGIVACTSPGGSKGALRADWSPLAGKRVVLWPDNDAPGESYMDEVESCLSRLQSRPKQILRLNPKMLGLPKKGDAADYIETHGEESHDEIFEALCEAKEVSPSTGVRERLSAMASGSWYAVRWPFPIMADEVRALYPGTLTLVCGDPGDGKSFLLLQCIAHWNDQGIDSCILELEEDQTYHCSRMLCQRAQNANLNDDVYVREHPMVAMDAYEQNKEWLDRISGKIWDCGDGEPSLSFVLEWVRDRAREGHRVICVDPVTAIEGSNEPWLTDKTLVNTLAKISVEYQCSIILVTHPKKNRQGSPDLTDLAGGSAYSRFSQTVIWIKKHYPALEEMIVKETDFGPLRECHSVNRTIKIMKSRNSSGGGKIIAYNFNRNTLCFEELGVIERKNK